VRILFFGDIVGRPGRHGVQSLIGEWKAAYNPDFIIANGENAAGGVGITPNIADDIFDLGVHVITLGNHAWHKKEVFGYLNENPNIIRPGNMPPGAPGKGWGVYQAAGTPVAVVNLCGRVFVGDYDDPFRTIDAILAESGVQAVFVDFHAETSSEKITFGWHVAGRVSAVVGTHTHVQTADERILPGGTAYITDVGMCGPQDGVIGMNRKIVLDRFRTQMPAKFEVSDTEPIVCAVVIDIDENGRGTGITRLQWRSQVGLRESSA